MIKCSESTNEIISALFEVQKALVPAVKDRTNSYAGNRYATMNAILDVCRDPLIKQGVLLTQAPCESADNGFIALETRFTHCASGQWISSILMIPLQRNDPQGMGAAITYGRRYALSAMLGIIAEDDNDCEYRKPQYPRPKQEQPRASRPARHEALTDDPFPPGPAPRQTPGPAPRSEPGARPEPGAGDTPAFPKINGVSYRTTTEPDGVARVIADGATKIHARLMEQAGFTYSDRRQVWYKLAS